MKNAYKVLYDFRVRMLAATNTAIQLAHIQIVIVIDQELALLGLLLGLCSSLLLVLLLLDITRDRGRSIQITELSIAGKGLLAGLGLRSSGLQCEQSQDIHFLHPLF